MTLCQLAQAARVGSTGVLLKTSALTHSVGHMGTVDVGRDDAAGEPLIPRQIVEGSAKDLHGNGGGEVGEGGFVLHAPIIGTAPAPCGGAL